MRCFPTYWAPLSWRSRSISLRDLAPSSDRTRPRAHSEGVPLLDADEHAVAGVVVAEAGAAFGGRDRPALRCIGAVIDGHRGEFAEFPHNPFHNPARGDVYAVGAFAVLHRGVGDLGFATDAVGVD